MDLIPVFSYWLLLSSNFKMSLEEMLSQVIDGQT